MTIVERALELVPEVGMIGLGSGRAARAFVEALGEVVRAGTKQIRGVPTSDETARLARQVGIPLISLAEAGVLDLTVDGADEVDPDFNLIKGYGRALVREKIVAASSRRLIILVGKEKLVQRLGSRGKLPVEFIPFSQSLCERRLRDLGCCPRLWVDGSQPNLSDNGNFIFDCDVEPILKPHQLENEICDIPGVVDTGLFLGMADIVLVGTEQHFALLEERVAVDHRRSLRSSPGLAKS